MLASAVAAGLLALVCSAGQPGTVTITKPSSPPVKGTPYYRVQLRIIAVDADGQEAIIAEPLLQTTGAAAGITLEEDSGRKFEFHFSAAEPGAPSPLPISAVEEKPIRQVGTPTPESLAEASLNKRVSVKAVQQPRREVLKNVARQAGLQVAMEPEVAEASAAKLAAPISVDLEDASLDEALKRLVQPLELAYDVRHDLVMIGFQQPPVVRQPAVPTAPLPVPVPPKSSNSDDWSVRVYAVSDLVKLDAAKGTPDFVPLLAALKKDVLPDSWSDKGGQATIRGFDSTSSIVVRHTSAGHVAIADYLDQRRQRKPRPVAP